MLYAATCKISSSLNHPGSTENSVPGNLSTNFPLHIYNPISGGSPLLLQFSAVIHKDFLCDLTLTVVVTPPGCRI